MSSKVARWAPIARRQPCCRKALTGAVKCAVQSAGLPELRRPPSSVAGSHLFASAWVLGSGWLSKGAESCELHVSLHQTALVQGEPHVTKDPAPGAGRPRSRCHGAGPPEASLLGCGHHLLPVSSQGHPSGDSSCV